LQMFSKKLREFSHVLCLVKSLEERIDHECDYLESHFFQLEYGIIDDEYSCLQNHDLHLENGASPDKNFVGDATLSIIKTDDNYSAMAKAAENQNIIEKTAWGNESSLDYFLRENQN
jgi:hypothetical protein